MREVDMNVCGGLSELGVGTATTSDRSVRDGGNDSKRSVDGDDATSDEKCTL
jgi:hypothetical protein